MTLPWMAERIQLRAIASLRPHAGNARVHDAAQLAQIMASMQAFGFTNPLLANGISPRHALGCWIPRTRSVPSLAAARRPRVRASLASRLRNSP
jgi:hypothetical protein